MLKDAVGAPPAASTSARHASALYAHFVVTVAFLDTMAQLPLLSPFAASLGAGAATVGVILGAYSLVNMIGNVAAGPVIDRAGRRVTIAGGMLIAGAALAAYALVRTPGQLLLLRLAHGAGGALLIPAVFAWMGDRARTGSVGRTMGYAGAAVAVAAMIGPAIGGIGRDLLGARPVFLGIGTLLCLTAVSTLFYVRDAAALRPAAEDDRGAGRSAGPAPLRTRKAAIAAVLAVLGNRHLRYAYWSVFGLTFAMGVLAYTFPLTMDRAGFSAGRTGAFFSVFAAAAILVLVLPANMQLQVMRDAVRFFGGEALAGVTLTKLDECPGLGAAVSALIESGLPALWLSEGQRVPEDLKLARVIHLLGWAGEVDTPADSGRAPPGVFGRQPATFREAANASA